jgi:putative DNA primase/helicase
MAQVVPIQEITDDKVKSEHRRNSLVVRDGAPMDTARAIVDRDYRCEGVLILRFYRGEFLLWQFGAYRTKTTDDIKAALYLTLEGAELSDGAPFPVSRNAVAEVLEAMKAVTKVSDSVDAPAWLDDREGDDPADLIVMRNGLFRLTTGELAPPTPSFFSLIALPYDFNRAAGAPVHLLGFLADLWPDDKEQTATLQEILGLLLTGDTSHQKAFFIVGPKRSGKGTIGRLIVALLGAENVAGPTLASLAQNFGLEPLLGKSVAVIGDARLSGKADQIAITERILSITGEDSITVDRKYRPAWTGRLGVRFVMLSNEIPKLSDASGALASRFLLLTLRRSFYGREDHGLFNRMLPELPAIFLWALEGLKRLRGRGHFVQPDAGREAIEELERLSSPVLTFVAECCTREPGALVLRDDLYDAWKEWCKAQGRDRPGTKESFGRDLHAALPEVRTVRPRIEGKPGPRYHSGIRLMRTGDPGSIHGDPGMIQDSEIENITTNQKDNRAIQDDPGESTKPTRNARAHVKNNNGKMPGSPGSPGSASSVPRSGGTDL